MWVFHSQRSTTKWSTLSGSRFTYGAWNAWYNEKFLLAEPFKIYLENGVIRAFLINWWPMLKAQNLNGCNFGSSSTIWTWCTLETWRTLKTWLAIYLLARRILEKSGKIRRYKTTTTSFILLLPRTPILYKLLQRFFYKTVTEYLAVPN